ncbi:MAG TPA: tetratricopeptide repeat protein [Gemmatimonadaceae bacterium]
MTTPNIPVRKRSGADEESLTEWFMLHKREVTWAAVALAIIVGGVWFYERSQSIKAQRAEAAYFQARQSAASGNPLAVSDFQKVASRYEGTSAGTQAALTLAQMLYDRQKFKEGLAVLKKAETKASRDFRPSIHVLEAAGYEEQKDLTTAAEQYKLAAEVTRFPADKAEYQAAAARDYMAAGKTDQAKAIWTALAKDDTGPVSAEARVRLGELEAKPLKI